MRALSLGAAALLCAHQPARAQGGGEPARQAVSIAFGASQENRRDDADSPLAYRGSGPAARIDFEQARDARRTWFSLAAGAAGLTPDASIPGRQPTEAFTLYSLAAGTSWRLRGGSPGRGEFALGVEFGAFATIARHEYTNASLTQQNFVLGAATLGPALRWTRRLGSGELAASLSAPLVALVDHPYADVRFESQLVRLQLSSLSQFRQANGELSYAFRSASPVGVTIAWRIGATQLEDLEPVRRVSQLLSVGLVKRFGGEP